MPNSTPLESGEPGTDVSRQSLILFIHEILSLAQLAVCLWEALRSHFLGIVQLPLLLARYGDITGFGCSWEKQS